MGKAGDIGDVVRLKGEYLYNVQSINGFSDDATGENPPQKEFEKTFRYSKDGVTFSSWTPLTLTNLQNIPLAQDETLYTEYAYKRVGTDPNGVLEVTEVTLSVGYFTYPVHEQYEQSFFDDVVPWHDSGAITWSMTVLRKVVGKGILPEFLNKKSEDSVSLWRSTTDFFSWIINYARKLVNFTNDENLLRKFLDNKGYFHAESDTVVMLNDVRENLYNRMSRRGTQEYKDQELKNLLNNNFPREYSFELSDRHKIGWNVGNSSPLYLGYEGHLPMVKGYEKSYDILDLASYPLINPGNVSIEDDNGLDVMRIASTPAGEIAGISSGQVFQQPFAIPVSTELNYQLAASVKVANTNVNLSFGIHAFDQSGNFINTYEANNGQPIKNFFFEASNVNQAGEYYKLRGILFSANHQYDSNAPSPIPMEFGGTHLELNPDTAFVSPFLYVDNQSGGAAAENAFIHAFHFTYLSADKSTSFVDAANIIQAYLVNGKGRLTDAGMEDTIEGKLKPYNAHVFFNWLGLDLLSGVPAPPHAPTGLDTTVFANSFDVSWDPHDQDIDGFYLYINGVQSDLPASQTSYTESPADPGSSYAVQVSAYRNKQGGGVVESFRAGPEIATIPSVGEGPIPDLEIYIVSGFFVDGAIEVTFATNIPAIHRMDWDFDEELDFQTSWSSTYELYHTILFPQVAIDADHYFRVYVESEDGQTEQSEIFSLRVPGRFAIKTKQIILDSRVQHMQNWVRDQEVTSLDDLLQDVQRAMTQTDVQANVDGTDEVTINTILQSQNFINFEQGGEIETSVTTTVS